MLSRSVTQFALSFRYFEQGRDNNVVIFQVNKMEIIGNER